jgi:hypothetical protein
LCGDGGDCYKAPIDNLMKQGEMRTRIVVSKEKMRTFGKYDEKMVSKGREQNTLPHTRLYVKMKEQR